MDLEIKFILLNSWYGMTNSWNVQVHAFLWLAELVEVDGYRFLKPNKL